MTTEFDPTNNALVQASVDENKVIAIQKAVNSILHFILVFLIYNDSFL
ncbi:MAG: hypothetical protein Q8K60_09320 [Parachlamydiaceae bacterium]|nr:hypothetical protein [Parachlamydiaceae bacterium]